MKPLFDFAVIPERKGVAVLPIIGRPVTTSERISRDVVARAELLHREVLYDRARFGAVAVELAQLLNFTLMIARSYGIVDEVS